MKNSSMRGGYIFLLPAAIIYLAVIAVPAFYSISLSFFKWNGVSPNMEFVALKNYGILIGTDPIFQHAVLNNIIWVLLTIILTVTVALFLANLLNRDFKGRTAFRGIFFRNCLNIYPLFCSFVLQLINDFHERDRDKHLSDFLSQVHSLFP